MKPSNYEDFTEDQKFCTDALAAWAKGYHHLPTVHANGAGVHVNWFMDLSTFDFDRLTRLVITAHAYAVRIEIESSGPRLVKIVAHRRSHEAEGINERHPTLSNLQAMAEQAKLWYALPSSKQSTEPLEPPTIQPDITPSSFIHPFVNALDTTDNTKQP